jgi:hypothetical protein
MSADKQEAYVGSFRCLVQVEGSVVPLFGILHSFQGCHLCNF